MTTQRDRARAAVARLTKPDWSAIGDLRAVVDEAQNAPPLGKADGTIDRELWEDLRCILNGYDAVARAMERIKLRASGVAKG